MPITTISQIVLTMFLWAICFPLITLGIDYAPHLTFAALRAVLAGAALTGLALLLRRPLPRGGKIWALLALVGIGATSLGFLGMFHAAEFVSPGVATVIANTQPLLAAGLAGVVLNERLTAYGKVGLFFGFVGIVVIATPALFVDGGENYALGIAFIVLAALGVTVSNLVIKRIAGDADAMMAMGLQMLLGSIPLAVGAWATEDPAEIQWTPAFIAVLLTLSLLGTSLVYWLWFTVLRRVPLGQANAFSFLIPIFGLTMGVLFFSESLGWPHAVGIALTLFGVGLVTRGIEKPKTV